MSCLGAIPGSGHNRGGDTAEPPSELSRETSVGKDMSTTTVYDDCKESTNEGERTDMVNKTSTSEKLVSEESKTKGTLQKTYAETVARGQSNENVSVHLKIIQYKLF